LAPAHIALISADSCGDAFEASSAYVPLVWNVKSKALSGVLGQTFS
jgi:hypothetical protein